MHNSKFTYEKINIWLQKKKMFDNIFYRYLQYSCVSTISFERNCLKYKKNEWNMIWFHCYQRMQYHFLNWILGHYIYYVYTEWFILLDTHYQMERFIMYVDNKTKINYLYWFFLKSDSAHWPSISISLAGSLAICFTFGMAIICILR